MTPSLYHFLPSVSDIEETKGRKDERMEQSAVDESSSKQQIRESADYTCIVRKTGALAIVKPGLTAGRQAGWQAVSQAVRQTKLLLSKKI